MYPNPAASTYKNMDVGQLLNFGTGQKIHYALRCAIAMCFIGHGAFGIITKPIWCNYFAFFGIGQELAYRLMPVIGTVDIILGLTMLFLPLPAIAGWLVIWGIATALLRPLTGEPFAEFIERAGNFGTPLAFLILSGAFNKNIKAWFIPVNPNIGPDANTLISLKNCLQVVVFLLLLGHGWLNAIEKKGLISQYTALGFSNPVNAAHVIGIFEIIAAFAILFRPVGPVLFFVFIWKITSESFYPHYGMFEWIERGGSYGAILALWFTLERQLAARPKTQSL